MISRFVFNLRKTIDQLHRSFMVGNDRCQPSTVAGPGFPAGGSVDLVGGRGLPRRLHFGKFVCQNERIGSVRGARRVHPLDPPMNTNIKYCSQEVL